MSAVAVAFPLILLTILYIRLNDSRLLTIPQRIQPLRDAPSRWTKSSILLTSSHLLSDPKPLISLLPPRTGRRYIVTGGAGFLGGWIVRHLIERGEDPRKIRVLDIRRPTRRDLCEGKAKDVDWKVCDVSDSQAVHAAFNAPWPSSESPANTGVSEGGITIFHTAACIRFYERTRTLLPFSTRINVSGTRNVLNAARSIGASVLVSTSSGSVALRNTRFLLWPWEKEPSHIVQFFGDEDEDNTVSPKKHREFFSNYAYTKHLGEELVLDANNSPSGQGRTLLTGCIRPGNGIYGPGGDALLGAALIRQFNPSWIKHVVQNFIYVENASYAHLCYEQKLIELADKRKNREGTKKEVDPQEISGRAYYVADAGAPPTYGDCWNALSVLSNGRAKFPSISPTFLILFSHIIECIYLSRCALISISVSFSSYLDGLVLSSPCPHPLQKPLLKITKLPVALSKYLPSLPEDLLNLQPSLFSLVLPHMLFSSYLATRDLGYSPKITTLEGVCMLVDALERGEGKEESRQRFGGGVGLRLRRRKTESATKTTAVGMSVDSALTTDSGVDLRLDGTGKEQQRDY